MNITRKMLAAVVGAFALTWCGIAAEGTGETIFSIDAGKPGKTLPNVNKVLTLWELQESTLANVKRRHDADVLEFVEYVETSSGRIAPRMLQRLAKVHGGNLLEVSKKLEKDLAKQPRLSGEEIGALRKQEKEIGADYFMENEPIIVKKLNDYLIELLEMDGI